ncbi:DUF4124 domain-containing protein [Litoribacillus peritrichatus]|uniref:DUF4124 domain-containing protein n=1 Tax=Litoribacillus peritrichatus TaxID=718191 RepID=A0ABP7NE85_9GAMM
MKIMIKLLMLALVGAIVAPMFIKGPDGRPMMSWQDLFSSSPESAYVRPSQGASQLTTVYKWKDENGQWHFSDSQVEGDAHETLKYNPKANIIQSLAKKEEPQDYQVVAAAPGMNRHLAANVMTNKPRDEEEELASASEETIVQRLRAMGGGGNQNGTSSGGVGLTTIPLSEVPKLIEQAKQVQALLDERNEALEKALGN